MNPKHREKLGQAAMEYVLTYSWAILVVMLAGIAIWQMGVSRTAEMSVTTFTGFPRIKPQLSLVSVTREGNLTAVFTNGAGSPIEILGINGSCLFNATYSRIEVAGNFPVWGTDCVVPENSREKYGITINIIYNISVGDAWQTHHEYGVIHGTLE